ncbi:MAG: DUF4374 domain-containing protein [Proteiniphilum sp.]|jgi:hypothetical protein|uniref:DUF4374 domain-containing protein n=1 Tax=Proteiniphilum sp. TaxID=1926877 RepID=UPI002B1FCE71|nr:DUF4374 domain-containing protein [Proteiniphilum sp.]MEA5062124.1 DUF4374 domain-containing protein [Petrimonas sp.]MEA5128959.1 DUF4374 domain-containing protein [Proteiniphilum sp.]
MKVKFKIGSLLSAIIALFVFASCDKDNNSEPEPEPTVPEESRFVIAAIPYMSYILGNGADLLYTAESLDASVILAEEQGVEQDGTYRNYASSNGLFFSLLFGQGNPGAVAVYNLNAKGELNKLSSFQTETMTAFAPVGDDILMFKNSWNPAQEYSSWYKVSTGSLEITGRGDVNTTRLAGNGELAHFSSLQQVGDKVFAPYFTMKDNFFGTEYPDSSWIAVFSYPSMQLEKVIKDDRTGAIGAYFTDCIEVDEKGDVYAIGTSLGTSNGASNNKNSTKPVAFMKINQGTTEYDKSYFFNISDVSGNAYVFRQLYLGKGNFLLMMSENHNTYANNPDKFAIANVYDKTFKWVSGLPAQIIHVSEYSSNYSPLDGETGYVGITYSEDGNSLLTSVFKFDATRATATPGLRVEGQNIITAINRVTIKKEG